MTTTFVMIYHPALGNVQVTVPEQAVDDYEARGWVLVDGNAPPPSSLDLTAALGDLRYLKLADVSTSGTTTGDALRAAYVAVPAGGSDGQAVVKAGSGWSWATPGGTPLFSDVRAYGAKVDGATDDAAAISAAITALGARGGVVFVPAGVTIVGSTIAVPSNVRIVGAGKNATIIKKTFNGVLLNFSGTDPSHRVGRGGVADVQLNGGQNTTGVFVQASYADHLNFDRVWFYQNNDVAFVGTELWDTYFHGCEFEWCGTSTFKTGAVVRLLSSATGSTNEVWFSQCRWESFPGHALFVDSQGNTGAPYGIYLSQCKMESAQVMGTSFIETTNDVTDVHIRDIYLAADALGSGGSAASSLINLVAAANMIIEGVHAWINNSAASCVIRLFPGSIGHAIRDVLADVPTAPANGIINFAGGNPVMRISNVRTKTGQTSNIYNGTVPSGVTLDDVPTVKSSTQTASYTLALTDADTVIEMNAAAGTTVTVPPNSSVALPVGTIIELHQYGAGQVTVAPSAGVTLHSSSSLATRAQYSTLSLRKRATDEWIVVGDLA